MWKHFENKCRMTRYTVTELIQPLVARLYRYLERKNRMASAIKAGHNAMLLGMRNRLGMEKQND